MLEWLGLDLFVLKSCIYTHIHTCVGYSDIELLFLNAQYTSDTLAEWALSRPQEQEHSNDTSSPIQLFFLISMRKVNKIKIGPSHLVNLLRFESGF